GIANEEEATYSPYVVGGHSANSKKGCTCCTVRTRYYSPLEAIPVLNQRLIGATISVAVQAYSPNIISYYCGNTVQLILIRPYTWAADYGPRIAIPMCNESLRGEDARLAR